jgi:hypothetical protein
MPIIHSKSGFDKLMDIIPLKQASSIVSKNKVSIDFQMISFGTILLGIIRLKDNNFRFKSYCKKLIT